jgi:hypothetical protein
MVEAPSFSSRFAQAKLLQQPTAYETSPARHEYSLPAQFLPKASRAVEYLIEILC